MFTDLVIPKSERSLEELSVVLNDWRSLFLDAGPGKLYVVEAEVSGWTISHHAVHIGEATLLNLKAVTKLARGGVEGAPLTNEMSERSADDAPPENALPESSPPDVPPLSPGGVLILTSGRIPRGRAETPEIVRPPDACLPPDGLGFLLQDCQEFVSVLQQEPGGFFDAAPSRIAHPFLGGFTARQWLRFAVVHGRHHLRIAREILDAARKPK